MTPRPPLQNPHEVTFEAAIVRALKTEDEYARRVAEADARVHKTVTWIGYGMLFLLSAGVLLWMQMEIMGWANIFLTLALTGGLWGIATVVGRVTRVTE